MIISIIGTRPQYIKVKPIYDYCIKNNIDHKIIDTRQHYSREMSENLIKDLGLNIWYSNNNVNKESEISFISDTINFLYQSLRYMNDPKVLIYGDTNSSFCAALVCQKLGIRFSHIEAGARCFNLKVPEEINRMFIDSVADVNFCSAKKDLSNIDNGIFTGDLEYELLNSMEIGKTNGDYGVLTVHRQENMSKETIKKIFDFCGQIEKLIILPIHHRLKNQEWFEQLEIPENINIIDACIYSQMANLMLNCRFILTDSGSILKTAPFFGKKTLILRSECGWTETIEKGFAKYCTFASEDISFISEKIEPDKRFYMTEKNPSQLIINTYE